MVQQFLRGDTTTVVVSLIKNKRQNGGQEGKIFSLLSLTPCPGGFSGIHERLCLYKACDFRVPTSHPKEGKPISSPVQVQTLYTWLIISENFPHGLDQGRGLGPSNPVGLPSCASWGSTHVRVLLGLFSWHLSHPKVLGNLTKALVY